MGCDHLLTWQRAVIWLLFGVAPHVCFESIPTGVIALFALALAPLACVLGLFGSASRAMHVLHMIYKLVVVLRRAPRAVSPLALGLRIFPDRILVVRRRARRVAPAI